MNALAHRTRDWLTFAALVTIGAAFRLVGLGSTKGYIIDEVYYAKDAHSLLLHGVELTDKGQAEFIVHPPVGKWIIALGIKLFGYNEFGWRFSAAVVGSLMIGITYFVAQRLFSHYFLSVTAALLMTVDGLQLVMSRIAMLDIFLAFFLLLTLLFLLQSRHWLAGISLGLAAGVKWTGFYYLIAVFAFVLYTDYRRRKALEEDKPLLNALGRDLWKRSTQFILVPVITYIASWIGWFAGSRGWDRGWANNHGGLFSFIPAPLRSLFHYHSEIYNFHKSLDAPHPYMSNPWSWMIMGRPTSFAYTAPKGCGASSCASEILDLGTPFLWWAMTIALFVACGYWISRREWQSGLLLLMMGAGFLPWFAFQQRTMFNFYAMAFEPFAILILVYVLSKFLESEAKRGLRFYSVVVLLIAIALCFLYFFPLYVGQTITYADWHARMWFLSWI